ncbi:NB-ARC domain-containing protein [Glycomyces sp. MUSA5-2]|uniref:NB-ARC domain-containing protein n=1 Tax=Glycomyces sp. MUSA5-2 TaxID=2053002 RepID=UPI00300B4E83
MPEGRTDELLSWAKEQLKVVRDGPVRRVAPEHPAVQTAIGTVLREALAEATAILLPGDPERQRLTSDLLLAGASDKWPLLDNTHPADLLFRITDWDNLLKAVDARPTAVRLAEPALALVGAIILERLRQADETRSVGSIWKYFVEDTDIGVSMQPARGPAGGTEHNEARFQLDNPQAHNLIQGQTVQVHMSPPSNPAAPAAPLRPHNFKRGPLLLGRIPQLAAARLKHAADYALTQILGDGPDAKVCLVVSGLAGTGKTQIAAAYARDRWDSGALQLMVWVTADSRAAITAAFAEAAARVCGSTTTDPDRAAAEFLDWLDRPTGPRWLIVLDGVAEPQHLVGLWPPESAHGRTVVTSRIRSASWRGARRAAVNISSFTLEEAAAFFREQFGEHSNRNEGAVALADHLGGLPLALAQAAAFIHNHPDMTCEDYFRMLLEGTIGLEDLCPGIALDGYPASVAATLRQSIDLAEQHRPKGLCQGLLGMLSLLSPDGVPVELLRSGPVLEALNAEIVRSGDQTGAPLTAWAVNAAIGRLHQLSLVDSEGGFVSVHPLVQTLVRNGIPAETRDGYARPLADALLALWPENDPDLEARLRDSASQLYTRTGSALIDGGAHDLPFRLGRRLGENGLFMEAVEVFTWIERDCTRVLGFEHPDALEARERRAWWEGEMGDRSGAVAALEELLLDLIRILGPDVELTLRARDDLAWLRGVVGEPAEAVEAYEELVPDWIRAMGPDHSRTLDARGFLAHWRQKAGDPAAAAADYASLLPDQERVFGANNLVALQYRSSLGRCLGEAGDSAAAEELFADLIVQAAEQLGPDDPQTLDARLKHAHWLSKCGDDAASLVEYESLLPDMVRVLGALAPDTLITRNNLASVRETVTGDRAAAAAEFADLLRDAEQALGPDNPDTKMVRENLALFQD